MSEITEKEWRDLAHGLQVELEKGLQVGDYTAHGLLMHLLPKAGITVAKPEPKIDADNPPPNWLGHSYPGPHDSIAHGEGGYWLKHPNGSGEWHAYTPKEIAKE